MPYFTQDSEENYVISRQEIKQLGNSLGDIFLLFIQKPWLQQPGEKPQPQALSNSTGMYRVQRSSLRKRVQQNKKTMRNLKCTISLHYYLQYKGILVFFP